MRNTKRNLAEQHRHQLGKRLQTEVRTLVPKGFSRHQQAVVSTEPEESCADVIRLKHALLLQLDTKCKRERPRVQAWHED